MPSPCALLRFLLAFPRTAVAFAPLGRVPLVWLVDEATLVINTTAHVVDVASAVDRLIPRPRGPVD